MNLEYFMKSDSEAIELRNEGKIIYNQRNFFDALLKYNESLCLALSEENLALAFASRSAVYMELKLYPQCLNNIRLARDFGYPAARISILDSRESRCLDQMKQHQPKSPHDPFKLSYKANRKIPFIIDGLKVEFDRKYGRKVITNRPLKVGDIISMETPFCQVILSDPTMEQVKNTNKFNYCSLCLNDNLLDLIPCLKCKFSMFCSEICKTQAHPSHQYECGLPFIPQTDSHQLMVIRSFFKALSIMNGSIEELEKLFIECLKYPKRTVFDFDFSNPQDPEYCKNQLRVALSLAKFEKLQQFTFIENDFMEFLRFKGIGTSHKPFVQKFLLHLLHVQSTTSSQIQRRLLTNDDDVLVGSGNYFLGSLMNHSCNPNVIQINIEDKMCLVVKRPIAKGEHLVESYTTWFYDMSVADRQSHLEMKWINCDCEACKDPQRFTMEQNFRIIDMDLYLFVDRVNKVKLSTMKRNDIIRLANKVQSVFPTTNNPDFYPSLHYLQLYDCLMKCWSELVDRQHLFK